MGRYWIRDRFHADGFSVSQPTFPLHPIEINTLSTPELSSVANPLVDIETRQEDVLTQLDELNRRIEKTLADCLAQRSSDDSGGNEPRAVSIDG